LRLVESIDVGGRKWEITVLSARGYFQERMQLTTWIILMAGIVFTLLVVVYMYTRARQSRTIVREVDRRTYELAAAKKKTEMILLSTKEGIIGLDAGGYITFCNPMAETLLGYAPGELIGKLAGIFSRGNAEGEAPALSPSLRRILESGEICTISDEIFWRKTGDTIEVEYNGSPLIEGGGIVGAVLLFRDISERKEMARQLEKMARYDQLTGLPNRALFMETLRTALARARRSEKKVGVIFMDLNGFKPVNDTLGHAAGDTLLKMFAERLSRVVRDTDLAARVGGDEFTLLVDSLGDVDEALILVERIRQALSKPFEIARHPFWITASMGIAVYPDHANTLDDLARRADYAMYKAKKEKSADCVIYSQAIEK
jgi:diguanylate cyclase (GGDEF)-like protein/PAS domain S-box-containing protein